MSARFFAASNAARSVASGAAAAGASDFRRFASRCVDVFAALDFFVGKLAAFGRATFLVRLSFLSFDV